MTKFNAEAYRAQMLAMFAEDAKSPMPFVRKVGVAQAKVFKKMTDAELQRHWAGR